MNKKERYSILSYFNTLNEYKLLKVEKIRIEYSWKFWTEARKKRLKKNTRKYKKLIPCFVITKH